MMKKFFKVFSIILSVLIFAFCLMTFVMVAISASKKTVPSIFNISVLSLSTKSMDPTYKVGDLVVVKKVDASTLKEGDVISFYSTDPDIYGFPNTHRIVGVENNNGSLTFTTKGDNNPSADKYAVEESRVIGKVLFKIAVLGKAIMFLQHTRAAYFLIIIVPIMVIFAFEMKNVIVKYREVKDDNEDENN